MEIDAEHRAAPDEESDRSDDSSADARDHDDSEEEEDSSVGEEDSSVGEEDSSVGEEDFPGEERDPARSVEELISKLESNEWPENEMKIEVMMLPHLLHHTERSRRALQGNTQITEVCIRVGNSIGDIDGEVELSQEDFTILGHVFAGLESLEKVVLETWATRSGFENLTAAAAFVKQTTQIQCLGLSVFGRETERGLDTRGYAAALSHLQALNSIVLSNLSPNESGFIVEAVPSLRSVELNGFALDDNILQQVLQLASLRRFTLSFFYVLSKRNLLTISDCLSSGSPLTRLMFNRCKFPTDGCDSLSVALKHNNTLEDLQFLGYVPGDTFFRKLKDSLPENKSLKHLLLIGDLSPQSATDLVAAVRGNYSLRSVITAEESLANCIDENQACILKCIPCLNQVGRRYMVEGPTTSERGLQVLTKVNEDLDCLFLHLQENPSLCTEMLRRVADGKRKVVAIGQDDEVPCAATKRCIESGDTELS